MALIAAVVVAFALWFGAATPGLAVANESPSPPALATLIGCTGNHRLASTTIGSCPADRPRVVVGGAQPDHAPVPARASVARPASLAVVAIAGVAIVLVAQLVHRAEGGLVGARAPPVSAS